MNDTKLPSAEDGAYAGDVEPRKSWDLLENDANAVLIDVRTEAEFSYVGVPDLTTLGKETKLIPWIMFPGNQANPDFLDQLALAAPDQNTQVLFLCRSGVRSRFAAEEATKAGYLRCYNILEGFEGDRDVVGHRGFVGGWKVARLPWIQS